MAALRLRNILLPLLLTSAAAVPYLNSIHGPWLMDDLPLIAHNPLLRNNPRWSILLTTDYWIVRGAPAGVYRPIPMLSFGLNSALWGLRPLPFHMTNLLLHVGVCLLFWTVLLQRSFAPFPLFAAFWFALHPVHVEAVANVIGRSELLVAFFFLLAWSLHVRAKETRQTWLRLMEFACWLLMSLSKENGVPLLALPLVSWWVEGRHTLHRLTVLWAPAILAGGAYLLLRLAFGIRTPELPPAYNGSEHLQLVFSATAKNFQLLTGIFTHKAVYPLPGSISLSVVVAGAILLVSIFVIPLLLTWRRSPAGVPAFAFLLSTVTLLQFYPNTIWVWERGLYVPSLAIAWIIGRTLCNTLNHWRTSTALVVSFPALALLGWYAYLCTSYSRLYSEERHFWAHEFRQNRDHLPTIISYSEVMLRSSLPAEREQALRLRLEAIAKHPRSGFAHAALASAALRLGKPSHAHAALTSASQIRLEFPSAVQRLQGYRQLAALAHRTELTELSRKFLQQARETTTSLLNSTRENQ